MHIKTAEIIAAIKTDAAKGRSRLVPAVYSWAFKNRTHVSAAFRAAKEQGIIEVAYYSVNGTPVYQAAGLKAATVEASSAVKH